MAINRAYFVVMPPDAGASPAMDIVLSLPGGPNAPVGFGTTPPPGWNGTGGGYAELRARPVRIENPPDARLGINLSIQSLQTEPSPGCTPSVSVIGSVPAPFSISLPDPSYGPVLRLFNSADVQGKSFLLNLSLYRQHDEDAAPHGP